MRSPFLTLITAITIAIAASTTQALELQSAFLPTFLYRQGPVSVLRADLTLLTGTDTIQLGPYASYEGITPQVTDTTEGAALRIGHDNYAEIQAGYFQRTFSQKGTPTETGKGFAATIAYGMHLSPHLGVAIDLSGKRITNGALEKRWIIDLLPLFTARVEF